MNSIPDEEEPAYRLYFDLLPVETLENNTRLLSSEPSDEDWPLGIITKDISHLDSMRFMYRVPADHFVVAEIMGYSWEETRRRIMY